MKFNPDYSIYLVTDSRLKSTEHLETAVNEALIGGCTLVQLREKELSSIDFYNLALRIKKVTDAFKVPLIINDRLDIALAVDAAGVHVGQSDLPALTVRKIIGQDKILGVSAATIEDAMNGEMAGADYIGAGAVFKTGTKTDAANLSIAELKKLKENVHIPVVAIGGINEESIPLLQGTGVDGLAIVSAIIGANDIRSAASRMKKLFHELH